ncbi:hypothetical protein [Streptomyces sp. BK205]|uniref:hypothetical protein n=1 Tax=Streptomyces sp. BK205 TaxID=2512164 RepID=UPI00104FC496|nr:hypothetical protein [Streptomyces sp. BK205]TCR15921.1 hypothetical protein EV578_11533 [Streptomyces sp. BK205]
MTAPLRPGSPTDPDELPVYVQPVDDTGMPLARPRPADYSFDDRLLHEALHEHFALLAAGELAHRHVAGPTAWNGPDLTAWVLPRLTVVVQFKSGWGSTSPTASPDHRLLPSAGAVRDTSALALWTYVSPLAANRSARELDLPLTAADLRDPDQWAGLHRARRAVTLVGDRGADAWLKALGRNPEVWREAAAAVLLADDWDVAVADPDRGGVGKYFLRRLDREMTRWRGSWERQLNGRRVALLSETLPGGRTVESAADETSECHAVERAVLDRLEITGDPCVLKIMARLTERETRIADIYARTDLSWAKAAELAGQRAQAGDTVYKKLRRFGKEHVDRARAAARGRSGHGGCPHSRLHPAGGPQPAAHTPEP